jgi:hypothetical protein
LNPRWPRASRVGPGGTLVLPRGWDRGPLLIKGPHLPPTTDATYARQPAGQRGLPENAWKRLALPTAPLAAFSTGSSVFLGQSARCLPVAPRFLSRSDVLV